MALLHVYGRKLPKFNPVDLTRYCGRSINEIMVPRCARIGYGQLTEIWAHEAEFP